MLAEALRSRSALLVLDNCEHLVVACAELVQTLLAACPQPDILVDDGGTTVAVRAADGRYRFLGTKGHRFEVETWLRGDGEPDRQVTDATEADGARCDALGCVITAGDVVVAVGATAAALADDCRFATVVVSRFSAPDGCAAPVVIDRAALARGGAHALYRIEGEGPPGYRIETARPPDRRPFMPPLARGAQ